MPFTHGMMSLRLHKTKYKPTEGRVENLNVAEIARAPDPALGHLERPYKFRADHELSGFSTYPRDTLI